MNNIVPLNSRIAPEIPKNALKAAVLIATTMDNNTIKFCSGSVVQHGAGGRNPRILSNHHCFAQETESGEVLPTLRSEACKNTMIYFNFTELTQYKATQVACLQGSLRTDPIGDLAIFELASEPPPETVPFLLWTEDYPPEGRKAYIIHHPDVKENLHIPEGGATPLPAASVTFDDCETKGLFPKEQWSLTPVLRISFKHSCDLIHGSSGSALIDQETNMILGVNWGGIKVNFPTGEQVDNVSTQAGYVRKFINDEDTFSYQMAFEAKSAKSADNTIEKNNVAGSINAETNGNSGPQKTYANAMCGAINASSPSTGNTKNLTTILFLLLPLISLVH